MPSFLAKKRSRLITVAAAGALTVATAITATVAALPSNAATASAGTAGAGLVAAAQHQDSVNAGHSVAVTSAQRLAGFDQVRLSLGARVHQVDAGVAQAAAKAAAAKAAAAKAAAAKAAAAKAPAAKAPAAKAPAVKAKTIAAAKPAGTPQQIAEQMLGRFGWSSSQFTCLYPLWEHESGWSLTAENPSSGAYGIPQSLPGSQMSSAGSDWQTDAATQIKWGLTYIQGRYGSPCGAWAHEQSVNWY